MHTENMSRGGVLIAWGGADEHPSVVPRVGELLTMELELPAHHAFGQKCIHCQGTVVRVNALDNAPAQIALNLNYMDFRPFEKQDCTLVGAGDNPLNIWIA